jgi:hypothetical protein
MNTVQITQDTVMKSVYILEVLMLKLLAFGLFSKLLNYVDFQTNSFQIKGIIVYCKKR